MITMKYYTSTTEFNCGIDLHARQMYVCVMDRQGKKLVHTNVLNNDFEFFLKLVEPYKHSLTVCCECMFGWYWLADACQEAGLKFVLAHALYLKAIHGGKNKNDRIDSEKLTHLLRSNLIPPANLYPAPKRPLRAVASMHLLYLVSLRTAGPHPLPSTGPQPHPGQAEPLDPRPLGRTVAHAQEPRCSTPNGWSSRWPGTDSALAAANSDA